MKLRQKLAMLMAATIITSVVPTITHAAKTPFMAKESMLLLDQFKYINPEPNHEAKNVNIQNGDNAYGASEASPALFYVTITDGKFNHHLFEPTIGNNALPEGTDLGDFDGFDRHTVYALPDFSKNANLLNGSLNDINTDYANRIFSIDEYGNYTSYVSEEYAKSVGYYKDNIISNNGHINLPANKVSKVYLFEKIPADNGKGVVYVNKKINSAGDGFVRNLSSFDSEDPRGKSDLFDTPATPHNEDTTNDDKETLRYHSIDIKYPGSETTQIYFKEFTLFKDRYGNDNILDIELYQNFNKGSNSRLYIPLAFTVTGKAPSIQFSGGFAATTKLLLSSNVVTNATADISAKRPGKLSVSGKGNLGIFDVEENQEFIFSGTFEANGYSKAKADLKEGTGGFIIHLQLKESDLRFDLSQGDRLWDKKVNVEHMPDDLSPYKGKLADYIELTGGLRTYEPYVQVEVLAVEEEEMVLRIIDETDQAKMPGDNDEAKRDRQYEGGIEFHDIPVDVDGRYSSISAGAVEMVVHHVDETTLEFDGNKVDDIDFKYSGQISERFVIAEVQNDNVALEVLQEAEVISGQNASSVEVALQELVEDVIDTRDEFYLTLKNGKMADEPNFELEFDGRSIKQSDLEAFDIFFEDEDDEYILDLDELYDYCVDEIGVFSENDKFAARSWHKVLDELILRFELSAPVKSTAGDIGLVVESDNFKEEEEQVTIGTVIKPFTVVADSVYVDAGYKEQKTGVIIIKETKPGMLQDGRKLIFELEDIGMDGRSFNNGTVTTDGTSDLAVDKSFDGDKGTLILTIKEESHGTPGTITIKDIQYDIWAGTPRGGYDLKLSGDAIDFTGDDSIIFKDYLYVGMGSGQQATTFTSQINFNAGSLAVNNVAKRLTSNPKLTTSGWTMVDIRDIATIFDLDPSAVVSHNDEKGTLTVTIVDGLVGMPGSSLVTFRNGSKIVTANGTPIIMGEAMRVDSSNRAYVPLKPLAEALGMDYSFNIATRVATMTK
ncbi:MAG: hypothetical protein ATN31_02165 [Candidatus Epulonipiscioides saccharophilum]|nr:MAG: hypothetical protein ATN31_02165 [Epulopiscium sp. AS2M-Bin001]